MKKDILDLVEDLCGHFLFYDRKEDDEIGVGDIEEAIKLNIISVEDIVNKFRECLELEIKEDE